MQQFVEPCRPMEHFSCDHKVCSNQHENSHKLCDEAGHPILCLMESQWKLRQPHQKFPMDRNNCRINSSIRKKSERTGL